MGLVGTSGTLVSDPTPSPSAPSTQTWPQPTGNWHHNLRLECRACVRCCHLLTVLQYCLLRLLLLLFLAREATKEMAPPRPSYAIDDGELSISLSSSQIRRGSRINVSSPQKAPDNTNPAHAQAQAHRHHHHHHSDHAHAHALDGPDTPDPSSNMASVSVPTVSATAGPIPDKVRTDQRIGQYNIVKTLGEGSFGKVKLAVHRSTGQQVALKIISRKKLISRDMAGRVEREIEYLQLLRHPHIIKL